MEARRSALDDFYTGPVWREHGPTANSTMIDSDDVLLLRPTQPPHLPLPPGPVEARVLLNVCVHEPGRGTCAWLAAEAQPVLEDILGTAVATWCTEPAPNSFPALPVREDHTFVWSATFADQPEQDAALDRLAASRGEHPTLVEEPPGRLDVGAPPGPDSTVSTSPPREAVSGALTTPAEAR